MDKKKELIICVGISGSGKSTWSTNFIKEQTDTWIRCNRDDIRRILVGNLRDYYKKSNLNFLEWFVTKIETFVQIYAKHKYCNVIIDNTHLKQAYIKTILKRYSEYDIKFKLFPINYATAKVRVFRRDEPTNPTEALAYIDGQAKQYKSIEEWIKINHPEKIM